MKSYYTLLILIITLVISLFSFIFLGKDPLIIKHNGHYFFPAMFDYNYKDFQINYNLKVDFTTQLAYTKIIAQSEYVLYPIFGIVNQNNQFLLDILSSIKYLFYFGLLPTLISLLLGLFSGIIQGYRGMIYDMILHRIYEIIISIPIIYLLMLLYTYQSIATWHIIIILGVANYGFFLIYIRKITFSLRNQPNIMHLESLHISKNRIMFKYLSKEVFYKIGPLLGFMFIANNLSIITLDFFNMEYTNIKTIGGILFDGLYNNKHLQTILSLLIFIFISFNMLHIVGLNYKDDE